MTNENVIFLNGRIFDGERLRDGHAVRFSQGRAEHMGPEAKIGKEGEVIDLNGDILSPGFVDLQVNGGGGVMFNEDPSADTLRRIATAHRKLGVETLLPTLITDTVEKTRAAIAAAIDAIRLGVPGVAGLHLEGPHLSVAKKGAHDPSLIRGMEQSDLEELLAASEALPVLKITVAPESVTERQVSELSRAGVLVSLGHSDADFDTCRRYFAAGARSVTHLFNAMSQLRSREPGLVGAALSDSNVSAGLIADSVHVHPETMRAALAAKAGPGRIFLVSDAMAVAGTELTEFELGGRKIRRRGSALTLSDGTLAGADLDLTAAIKVMVDKVGVSLETALHAATTVPSNLIGREVGGNLSSRRLTEMIRISENLSGTVSLI